MINNYQPKTRNQDATLNAAFTHAIYIMVDQLKRTRPTIIATVKGGKFVREQVQ